MSTISKLLFDNAVSGLSCHQVIHPWHSSCFLSNLQMYHASFKGSLKFLGLFFALQLMMKGKNLTWKYALYLLRMYSQTALCCTVHGGLFVSSNCAYRKLCGNFNYYFIAFGAACFTGFDIFLELPNRRNIIATTFISMSLEVIMRRLEALNMLKRTRGIETMLFMACSSILLYCIRSEKGSNNLWFFMPPGVDNSSLVKNESKETAETQLLLNEKLEKNICPHGGSCWKDIMKAAWKYFGCGVLLQCLKVVLPNTRTALSNPVAVLRLLMQKKNVLFGAFIGGYVGLYKLVSCILCNLYGTDCAWHALPAGFTAGAAYWLQPNLTILFTALAHILKICGQVLKARGIVPNWPFCELTFVLCNGLLFHHRVFHPQLCPPSLLSMMDTITSNKARVMYTGFKKIVDTVK